MGGEPDISVPARALGDPARALMASALLGNRQIPASELARVAGVSASTASEHLRVLMNAELIDVEQRGRNRFYRLASESAARAVEALQGIAPLREVRSLRQSSISADLRHARTCYDHLAGDLGMRVTDLLTRSGVLSSLAVGESVDAPSPFPQGVIVDTLQLRPPQGARAWGGAAWIGVPDGPTWRGNSAHRCWRRSKRRGGCSDGSPAEPCGSLHAGRTC